MERSFNAECQGASITILGDRGPVLSPAVGGSGRLPWEAGMWETGERGRARLFHLVHHCHRLCPALSWWPRSRAQRRAVRPTKQTTSVAASKQNVVRSPPRRPEEARAQLTFQHPAPKKTSVNDSVRGEESLAASPRRRDLRPDITYSSITQRVGED